MRSEQVTELAAALAKAQGAMSNATLNKTNPHFKSKYADLASVLDAAREPLSANGIAVTQTTEIRDGSLVLVTTLLHSSGQWLASEYPLPSSGRPQEMGSALTYAKRYTLSALICIAADEDDDANGAENDKQRINTPKPVKPSVVTAQSVAPPHNPQTGELGPHTIAVPQRDGADDWIAFGSLYIAAVKSAQTPDEANAWLEKNATTLDAMKREASPKIYDRMTAAVVKHRAALAEPTKDEAA